VTAALDSRPGEGPACPSTGRHDSHVAYLEDGCRCPTARRANARYAKVLRLEHLAGERRLIDATGTARRLRALMTIGWAKHHLADQLGVSTVRVDTLLRQPTVRRPTAARVVALYEHLSDTPGPSTIAAAKTRALGYPPPIAWDDDTIDDPDAVPWLELHADGVQRPGRIQCARDGCRTWFVPNRKRIYCDPDCARAAQRDRDRVRRRDYFRQRDRTRVRDYRAERLRRAA
jgi:hypothetical protein